jgi:saccharopine dehydrogenase-like NADP-dependent oxidoreductase
MRKYLLVSTGLAMAFAAPAHAEKWYLVGESPEDLFFADADSVSKNGQYLQVNVIDSLAQPVEDEAGKTYYYRGPVNFDCTAKQFKHGQQSAIGLNGEVLAQFDPESKWDAAGSGTHAEALIKFACEGAFRDEVITDPFSYSEDYWYYYYADDEADQPATTTPS